ELANALAREVGDVADLLERVTAGFGDVECARVLELPRLEVREVKLDRSGARIDVEIEVVLARHPRARPHLVAAFGARARPTRLLRRDAPDMAQLRTRQPARRDRATARPRAPRPQLPTRRRHVVRRPEHIEHGC